MDPWEGKRTMQTTEDTMKIGRFEFDVALKELPRQFAMKTTDLGYSEAEYRELAQQYAEGSEAESVKNFATTMKNVLFELMSRDVHERVLYRNTGNTTLPWYITDESGNVVMQRIANGSVSPKVKTKRCSRWAVDVDDCVGAPTPFPGFYKQAVEQHLASLLPELVFLSDVANPGNIQPQDVSPSFEAMHAGAISDRNPRRNKLLEWLRPFLKAPVSKWEGKR